MTTPRFECIGLIANDMAATLAFYRKLGLDIPTEADSQPHVDAPLPGGVRLMWDSTEIVRSLNSDWDGRTDGTCLAFGCDSPSDVDRVYAEFTEAGYRSAMTPFDAEWGQRYASILDPDGNAIDLFAPLNS